MGYTITDYLLVTTDDRRPPHPEDMATPAGARRPVPLADSVHLESVDSELAERLLLACEFPARRVGPRHVRVAQAFVRRFDTTHPNAHALLSCWDADRAICDAVMLSRLVRPNAIGFHYAVRHVQGPAASDDALYPADPFDMPSPIGNPLTVFVRRSVEASFGMARRVGQGCLPPVVEDLGGCCHPARRAPRAAHRDLPLAGSFVRWMRRRSPSSHRR